MYREPDSHIGFDAFDILTRGQLLSILMMLIGVILLIFSYYNRQHERIS